MKIRKSNVPYLTLGAGIGTAIGVATDSIGLWLAVGVSIGIILDGRFRRTQASADNNDHVC